MKSMKTIRWIPVILALGLISCRQSQSFNASSETTLWYTSPAIDWNEALPVGNGGLGAMVFGHPWAERLQINEESVWCRQGSYTDPDGSEVIPRIRELLFAGEYREAEDLAVSKLLQPRLPGGSNAYQTLGDVRIRYADTSVVQDYRRELLLDSALVRVRFERNGTRFERVVFSSAPDDVLVFREQCEGEERISCHIGIDRPGMGEEVTVDVPLITMKQHVENGQGVRYEARLEVRQNGGTMEPANGGLYVRDAESLEIRLWAATDYNGGDPSMLCDAVQESNHDRTFAEIRKRHVEDYRSLFGRVGLDLGRSLYSDLPTDERISGAGRSQTDPGLAELYFNFGRYLLISSSRPGNLPANLQGIWNKDLYPPWNADYHININIQMNYWPAEVTNLSECHVPFLYFIGRLGETGGRTAAITYNARGFTAHHTTDAWLQTQLFGAPQWGMWPMGAAWASTHIWEHFLFTGDTAFLSEYGYGVMKEAALFLADYMVRHPETGHWVTGPSISPENLFATPGGDTAALNMGPAMDLQIVRHLFTACISASDLLDTDHGFRELLQTRLEGLAPVEIGPDGRIQEWSEEGLREVEPGHRHMSHLYGLFPSAQYNWDDTPGYMEAAEKVIGNRLEHGGGHTGWSRAWMINFYARLRDGQQALHHLDMLLQKSTLPNMFDNHPPFQIDGNFGGTAGIAECLLQSHTGIVDLLPALPPQWPDGTVTGLMARGGFEVDMEWERGRLVRTRITSRLGGPVSIRYGAEDILLDTRKGGVYLLDGTLKAL